MPVDAPSASGRAAPVPFAAAYREHHDAVWRILRHFGVSEGAVDDATQDVFMVLYRRRSDYDGVTPLRAWLTGIARRVALKYRERQRRSPAPVRVVPEPADTRQPDDAVARAEAADVVQRFLLTLDDDKRQVFVLADVEGMTAPEIASALGVKLNTVYSRLRIARERFERALTRQRARALRGES